MTARFAPSSPVTLFLLYFCYATSAALIFQKFLLPLVPSLHAGQGLLQGDAAYFHSVAVELVERIRHDGWGAWSFYPAPGSGVNVAVLAALYLVFGTDPSVVTPINAALHALGGVLIVLTARTLWHGRIGDYAGVAAGTLFVIFPSALNWYGQIHKDAFSIAGTLLIIFFWMRLGEAPAGLRGALRPLLGLLVGTLLVISVRPYHLIILALALALAFVVIAACKLSRSRDRESLKTLAAQALGLALVAAVAWVSPRTAANEQGYVAWTGSREQAFVWKEAGYRWMPRFIEGYAEVAARTRAGLIEEGKALGAASLIDETVTPGSVPEIAAYMPRALQIGLFAPFPTRWFEKISPTRMVAVAEMLLWYLIAPGVLLAFYYRRSATLFAVMALAAFILAIYGFTLANVGTLYRVRYPFLFLFMMAGLAGWTEFLARRGWPRAAVPAPPGQTAASGGAASTPADEVLTSQARASVFGAGALVALITGLAYLGLFVRDVIMARFFGLGSELDAFLVATLVPMFLVSVFSIPIGTTTIPAFIDIRQRQSPQRAQELVTQIAFAFVCFISLLAVALLVTGPLLIPAIGWNFPPQKIGRTIEIMIWMLPILVLSGIVVLGNALLNALGRYAVPASAQAVVAVFAIIALLLFGRTYGALSAVIGMFIGQVLNLLIVMKLLRKEGVSITPAVPRGYADLGPFLTQYLPLVAAALFVNLAGPVNTGMASALSEGSVSALGLGNKVVLFMTGVVGSGVATVMLPYFSRVLARSNMMDANRELSFFIVAATAITIPVSIVLYVSAEPIVQLVFQGGLFQADDVRQVARVLAYGILLLPFFTVNVVLLKFAIAARQAGRAMLASVLGLCVNVALNLALMDRLGAAGIALATTLSIAFSTAVLLLLFHRRGHIAWVDLIMIALNWMLFMTLAVCLHYNSYAGVVATLVAFAFLALSEWKVMLFPRGQAAR